MAEERRGNETSIELASRDDIPAILKLMNDEAQRSLATAAHGDEDLGKWERTWSAQQLFYPWLVARRADRVVGYAKAGPYSDRDGYRWSVNLSIYLSPAAQGSGLAFSLYQRLFTILTAQGYRAAYARIALPNEASCQLHRRFGLQEVGRLPAFGWKFGRWYDVALFVGAVGDEMRDDRSPPPLPKPLARLEPSLLLETPPLRESESSPELVTERLQ